jgi:DNA-binding NarL/FixJ family response regulator
MRVILVGSPRDRARLRERAGALEIAAEADNLTDARALADGVDAFLVAHDTGVSRDDDVLIEALTDRETEVLELLAAGRSDRQIARELYITEKTAGHHVSHILTKLTVTRRGEAAAIAHRIGMTGPAGDPPEV